jgi:hypothetical protein
MKFTCKMRLPPKIRLCHTKDNEASQAETASETEAASQNELVEQDEVASKVKVFSKDEATSQDDAGLLDAGTSLDEVVSLPYKIRLLDCVKLTHCFMQRNKFTHTVTKIPDIFPDWKRITPCIPPGSGLDSLWTPFQIKMDRNLAPVLTIGCLIRQGSFAT